MGILPRRFSLNKAVRLRARASRKINSVAGKTGPKASRLQAEARALEKTADRVLADKERRSAVKAARKTGNVRKPIRAGKPVPAAKAKRGGEKPNATDAQAATAIASLERMAGKARVPVTHLSGSNVPVFVRFLRQTTKFNPSEAEAKLHELGVTNPSVIISSIKVNLAKGFTLVQISNAMSKKVIPKK